MKTVMFLIPEDFHTSLKTAASSSKMTLKGYVIEAIKVAVEKTEKEKKS